MSWIDKDIYFIFINFKDANGSINRNNLWIVMFIVSISENIARLIHECIKRSICIVKFANIL